MATTRAYRPFGRDDCVAEFPPMPASPYARDAVIETGPDLANRDFRVESGQNSIIEANVAKMGSSSVGFWGAYGPP